MKIRTTKLKRGVYRLNYEINGKKITATIRTVPWRWSKIITANDCPQTETR